MHKQISDFQSSTEGDKGDVDMQRAIDLVALHYGVKMKHIQGDDEGLKQARRDVNAVLKGLSKKDVA